MRMNNGIIIRYEPQIENGVLYIFDLNNEKVYKGNYNGYILLKAIQSDQLEEYKQRINAISDKELVKKMDVFVKFLTEKEVLVVGG